MGERKNERYRRGFVGGKFRPRPEGMGINAWGEMEAWRGNNGITLQLE